MTQITNGTLSKTRRCGCSLAALIAVLGVGLSACTRLDDYTAAELQEPAKRHPIAYTPHTEALLVEVPPAGGLSAHQQADVVRFLDRYKREGTGRLQISAPRGAAAHLATSRSVRQVEAIASEAGIDLDAVEIKRHGAGGRAGPAVQLAYEKPVAVPPQCRDWATDLGENRERLPYNDFGCASRRNFALTVANARDLQVPQPETPSSSEKRGSRWKDYTGADDGAAQAVTAPVTTSTTSP